MVPLVFIILFSVLVLVELCKMRKRAHTGQQQDSINATKYILTIVAVFIMCLCPLYVDLLIDLRSYPTLALVLDWFSIVAFMLYGIVNTVIYGWKNKTYRSVFCQLIKDCCFLTNKCCNNSVHPTVWSFFMKTQSKGRISYIINPSAFCIWYVDIMFFWQVINFIFIYLFKLKSVQVTKSICYRYNLLLVYRHYHCMFISVKNHSKDIKQIVVE